PALNEELVVPDEGKPNPNEERAIPHRGKVTPNQEFPLVLRARSRQGLIPCYQNRRNLTAHKQPVIVARARLCTKNTSRALIERPYSCAPQAVGAVYDRPGFFVQSPRAL